MESLKATLRKFPGAAQVINWLRPYRRPVLKPHGPGAVDAVGHREYVGGLWEEIGKLQFDFLVGQGLRPHHFLLDIACGSLRAGVHFIPYLEPGHYLGVDRDADLIEAGLRHELPSQVVHEKRPRLIVSSEFEFEKFGVRPDYALAHSLFTHLPADMIVQCMSRLRENIKQHGVFFATFFETRVPHPNLGEHPGSGRFLYTRHEIGSFGAAAGWDSKYVGQWGHPRGQVMVRYSPST